MRVFLSYTRNKDQFGAVSEFGAHFAHELDLHVPGSTVFRDTLHIETGQPFPDALWHELRAADLLLMLVSPAWLRSVWCRFEYDTFVNVGSDGRNRQRLLPVLWVPTPLALDSNDAVVRTLAALQFDNWTELRHLPWTDVQCRQRIAALAARAPALLARPRLPEQAETMLKWVAEEGAISKEAVSRRIIAESLAVGRAQPDALRQQVFGELERQDLIVSDRTRYFVSEGGWDYLKWLAWSG